MILKSLKGLVKRDSLLWGQSVADDYHGAAARDMQQHWDVYIEPAIRNHPIDYSHVIDFACGYGRNTDFLLKLAEQVTMIDVNMHNVEYCRVKYSANSNVVVRECNGYDLRNIGTETGTFFYTFDSMVHFPPKIIEAYLPEFFRVLRRGGYALIHHSNYTAAGPRADFRENPHWRNYMSAQLFASIAEATGFSIVEQTVHAWGIPELDCVTVLRRP